MKEERGGASREEQGSAVSRGDCLRSGRIRGQARSMQRQGPEGGP